MRGDSGRTRSPWFASANTPPRPPLPGDSRAEVCVIGAGMAGLSVAYHLALEGRSVLVLDDGPIGGGQSGRTTAHLSNAIDDLYVDKKRQRRLPPNRMMYDLAIDDLSLDLPIDRTSPNHQIVDV